MKTIDDTFKSMIGNKYGYDNVKHISLTEQLHDCCKDEFIDEDFDDEDDTDFFDEFEDDIDTSDDDANQATADTTGELNIYFDVSGDNYSTLKQNENRFSITDWISDNFSNSNHNVYMFAETVAPADSDKIDSVGTAINSDAVIEHIKQTNPSDVIVVTNRNIDNSFDDVESVEITGTLGLIWNGSNAISFQTRVDAGKKIEMQL